MAQPYSSQVKRDREAQKPFFLHSFTPSTHIPELPHARGPMLVPSSERDGHSLPSRGSLSGSDGC